MLPRRVNLLLGLFAKGINDAGSARYLLISAKENAEVNFTPPILHHGWRNPRSPRRHDRIYL